MHELRRVRRVCPQVSIVGQRGDGRSASSEDDALFGKAWLSRAFSINISIRFMAQRAGAARQPCHHGNRSCWFCPSGGRRPPPTIMRRASELLRVIAKPLLDGSDSGSQTEALKGAVHILPSRSRLGTSASDEGVVTVVMALLSFAESAPRA